MLNPMKPVRLPASATLALPRWGMIALCLLYILPGLIGRDPWKGSNDAAGFGIMWTMAHGGLQDWLWPHIAGLPMAQEGPLAYWIGALCIQAFGWLLGDTMAARIAPFGFFLLGSLSVWYATFLLGQRPEAQPLKLAFGGQPEPRDFGRTLADSALLIYLGCLGLLLHAHSTSASSLQVSLVAFSIYLAARLFGSQSRIDAIKLGAALGLLILTRGWVVPLALLTGLFALAALREKTAAARMALLSLPVAAGVAGIWLLLNWVVHPFNSSPFDAWMDWNFGQADWPTWDGLTYLLKNGIGFAWPAWPFAGWAIYAWRKQRSALHIMLPQVFLIALTLLALINPHSEEAGLLPLLPPLAMLAAFGLPTMKRGAINAVDWFSVMTLSTCAAFIWVGWIAKQTGWPAQLAKNAFKLAPGFKPEISLIGLLVAVAASAGWIALVHWRISRRPSVLWRAVVLSSGGVILCWLLLTTLWLPWFNYRMSYAGVAQQIESRLPPAQGCVESNAGPAQRASFAYFGHVRFARFDHVQCDFLLLQDSNLKKDDAKLFSEYAGHWALQWEGGRPADRDERFRLYRRVR
jgi:4-amino-4-deoxy-L-arabinose transferase-like glycosyltransferase